MPLPSAPLDRRTVLAGAAWSVPVIATAVAAPAAAASDGTLEIDFVAAYLQLEYESTIAGVIAITNTGTGPLTRSVTITLPGLAKASDSTYAAQFGPIVGDVDKGDGSGDRVSTVNSVFVPTTAAGDESDTLTLTAVDFPFPTGTVFIAILFSWPTDNTVVDGFIIAGSFTITPPSGASTGGDLTELTLGSPESAAG